MLSPKKKRKVTTATTTRVCVSVYFVSLDLDVSSLLCDTMARTETKILFTFAQNPNFISFSIVDVVCVCTLFLCAFCFLLLLSLARFLSLLCFLYFIRSVVCSGVFLFRWCGVVFHFKTCSRFFPSILRARKCVYVCVSCRVFFCSVHTSDI